MPDLREQLQEFFGLDDFRPAQREVIKDVLRAKDVLCVMPTGAGKSLCYQLPAVVGGGLTLVVSPLISLMEDQVQQLREEEIPAAMLHSSMSAESQREVMNDIASGFSGLLYVAPERFFAAAFRPLLHRLKPQLLAIDEAHCVSQWGHDFRPEYARLGEVRQLLGDPPVIALTATATDDVREDIIRGLRLRDPSIVITGFDRPNLLYASRRVSMNAEKEQMLHDLLTGQPGDAIIYCSTRKAVDELTTKLRAAMPKRPIFSYHAGMQSEQRTLSQEQFMDSTGGIAVATNAFGMGINKPDVRLVVHYNMPGTLEAYYQEAGRAGRDGQPAHCVLLFSYQDRVLQEFFINKIGEDRQGADETVINDLKQRATDKLDLMMKYAGTHSCRRQQILDYFGDEAEVVDCHCDICGGTLVGSTEISEQAVTVVRQLLSGIARMNGNFGTGAIAEVLAGISNERSQRWGFEQLTVFGLLRLYPTKQLIAMLHRVIESCLARQKNVGEERPMYVVELTAAGIAVMKGAQAPPAGLGDILPRGKTSSPRPPARSAKRVRSIEDPIIDPISAERFERLRLMRLELSKEVNLPPYCICHDSTLKLIAVQVPDNLESLADIKGMGPFKVKRYGEKLLAVLRGTNASSEPHYVDEE